MLLEGKLSADKGTQTQPNCRSRTESGGEKRQDHGPGEGQAFLLTEAALPVSSSSWT